MNSKFSTMKSVVIITALVAGVSGMARADVRSSFHEDKPVVDNSAPAWRQSHPHGLTESEFQSLSTEAPAFNGGAVAGQTPVSKDAPSWRQSRRQGLTEREMQGDSSESPEFHGGLVEGEGTPPAN